MRKKNSRKDFMLCKFWTKIILDTASVFVYRFSEWRSQNITEVITPITKMKSQNRSFCQCIVVSAAYTRVVNRPTNTGPNPKNDLKPKPDPKEHVSKVKYKNVLGYCSYAVEIK